MATKNRRTKAVTFRARFASAADAKAVAEKIEAERTGRTLVVDEENRKAFNRACKRLDLEPKEVGSVGRPTKAEKPEKPAKAAPRRPADKLDDVKPTRRPKSTKVSKKGKAEKPAKTKKAKAEPMVVLAPSQKDARKLAKALDSEVDATNDGARITLVAEVDSDQVYKLVRRTARKMEMPISFESGFGDKNRKPAKAEKPEAGDTGSKTVLVSARVQSSNIERVRYDVSRSTLRVEFKNGRTYRYNDVTWKEFGQFLSADSHGEWFNANIKGTKDYVEIG